MLLAFDTATHAVTVALNDGARTVAETTTVDALRHGELLAPTIAEVLTAAGATMSDVSRVAVGVGPGPFTGLRVGIVTARTLSAALGISLVGVCTLDVVAAAVTVPGPFVVATDARRREVYWASYRTPVQRLTAPAVDWPDAVASDGPVAGRGPALYPGAFPQPVAPEFPRASDLATLVSTGRAVELAPEPLYLRRPDTAAPSTRKRVL